MTNRRSIGLLLGLSIVFLVALTGYGEDLFVDSGQRLGDGATWGVAIGDVDRDGDLDAVVANLDIGAVVWLNDSHGLFTDSGQRLSLGTWIELADLDGDGALDVLTGSWDVPLTVWWNDGRGVFPADESSIVGSVCLSLDIGDLDGDSDVDVFVGRAGPDLILLNEGDRTFRDSGQRFGAQQTGGVAIGDMDGDGDLDVVAAGWDEPGHVWVNDGNGILASRCELEVATLHVHSAALADYDSDGDLDVFFALAGRICCRNVWLNDGTGRLTPESFDFGSLTAHGVAVADLDKDEDQDLILAIGGVRPQPSTVWLGEDGDFADSGLRIGLGFGGGVALGDLDGDGDRDLFIGFSRCPGTGPQPNEVWMNGSSQ